MADSEPESQHRTATATKKTMKRKLRSAEKGGDERRPSKAPRLGRSEKKKEREKPIQEVVPAEQGEPVDNIEGGHPWRNLHLILSLQNKDIAVLRKVELAFGYVKSRERKEGDDNAEGLEAISISRVMVFLTNWVQTLLISSEKKIRTEGYKPQSGIIESCWDYRSWEIFRYCLEESLKMQVSLNVSKDFLRVIHVIARDALSKLNVGSHLEGTILNRIDCQLYRIVVICLSLVFSSHCGILNENLDLWIMTADTVLELVKNFFDQNLEGDNADSIFLQFSCAAIEPFVKFLRVHPTRKNGFCDFIEKLLEPLLHLLGVLHLHVDGSYSVWTRNLLKLIEEVFCYGLFHPANMDGFLSLQSTGKYVTLEDGKPRDSKIIIKSYHRHLFDKLEKVLAGKNKLASSGVGDMFHLFVSSVKNQKGASVREGLRHLENDFSGHMPNKSEENINLDSEKSHSSTCLKAETRQSLIDFFVQIMEPLLQELNIYSQAELEVGPVLYDLQDTLHSTNKILVCFLHDKLYIRNEDISEGGFFNFLKGVYDMVLSFLPKILHLRQSTVAGDKIMKLRMLSSLATEVVIAVCHLVEIEYMILGNDLESLWLMVFSFASLSLSLPDLPDQCRLISEILSLGCQLVNLYSELRQVNDVIWALCKAVRHLVLHAGYGEMININAPLLYREAHAKSVSLVLCSQEFRLAIRGAIGSIPVGQVSGCVQQLKTDISECLKWVKGTYSSSSQNELGKLDPCSIGLYFDVQAELLGRCLSEMHTLVLDSLTVASGNSNLISVSAKDLMTVLRPSMNSLVAVQPDGVNEFLFTFTGKKLSDSGNGIYYVLSTRWILVFFFRLYLSCRSLYRQALSLVGPDTSRKMSELMGDSLTAHTGKDWLERTDWTSGGYFSWIFQASASLPIILQSVSDFCLEGNKVECAPLIYVLNTMAIQRLVDLNRLIKSFDYLLERKEYLKLVNDGGASPGSRNSKKLKKCIRCLRQEAADLSNFVMGYLPFLAKHQLSNSSPDVTTYKTLDGHDKWDFEIGALNENSLPSALWWIICQSIDVWCAHAAKKKLKMFLTLLFQSSLLRVGGSFEDFTKQKSDGHGKNITARQISLELLQDTVLYEQSFVRRLMGSRFCRILEKSILSIFTDVGETDLKSSPNLLEASRVCGDSSTFCSGNKYVMIDSTEAAEPIASSSKRLPSFLSHGVGLTDCQNLLSFLCWMPKACLSSKSFSLCATYILKIERLVVGSLLESHGGLYSENVSKLFELILSCRRALKNLTVASCEEKMGSSQSSLAVTISQSSSIVWLLESLSAVILPQHAASENSATQEIAFSLMDHTSCIFLTLSKYQFVHAFLNVEKPSEEQDNCSVVHKGSPSDLKGIDAWKTLVLMAETLKERIKRELVCKKGLCDAKMQVPLSSRELVNLNSIISCSQGFMWGLAAALDHVDINNRKVKAKLLRQKHEPMYKLICCMDAFAEFVNYFAGMLLVEDGQLPGNFCDGQNLPMPGSSADTLGVKESFLYEKENQNCGALTKCSASSSNNNDCDKSDCQKSFHSENADFGDSILAKCDSFDLCGVNKSLLNVFLRGENPEAAFFVRQLFIASSALLRLNMQIKCASLSISSVPIFVGISQVLLTELANNVEVLSPLSLVYLDGVVKFLDEIGSHFHLTNPTMSRNLYVKMVELHLVAIGICIVLQGKRASLASHDVEASAKTLSGHMVLSEYPLSCGSYYLDELKARLRMSFKGFVKKPSELHLLDAIQSLERALVGVQLGCTINYEICIESSDRGKVSSIVAAGIDCMDLVLEFVTGRKRTSVVKSYVRSLVACLFNIILHLQGPSIFYRNITSKHNADPDPGSVILMCVEVLTKVFGKHAVYQLDSSHVGQSLRIPAALFQNFFQLRISEAPSAESAPDSLMFLDGRDTEIVEMSSHVVDRQFLIELFAACCRLLGTVLKHYKSETEHCVALLEDSASVLLHCLEMVDPAVVGKCYFTWEVPEAVKCASFLRRIYEEMRQQKDVFGRHCSLFLSSYIWTYSGCGPLKTGIRREVDEALRPGVYALIDACSVDDLQHLHTIFGEGPCRSTLATLQHDYKLNFQYEGKV